MANDGAPLDLATVMLGDLRVAARGSERRLIAPDTAMVLPTRGLRLLLLVDGEARLDSRDQKRVLRSGDLLYLVAASGQILSSDRGAELIIVAMDVSGGSLASSLLPSTIHVCQFAANDPTGASLITSALGNCGTPSAVGGDDAVCSHIVTAVLAMALRAALTGGLPVDWERFRDPLIARALTAIHADPGAQWRIADLAALTAMSRSVFAERFRQVVGSSPHRYLTQIRVSAAQQHLTAGRSVGEVARLLGYGSEEGFSRAFRRATGINPSVWRAQPAQVEPTTLAGVGCA